MSHNLEIDFALESLDAACMIKMAMGDQEIFDLVKINATRLDIG